MTRRRTRQLIGFCTAGARIHNGDVVVQRQDRRVYPRTNRSALPAFGIATEGAERGKIVLVAVRAYVAKRTRPADDLLPGYLERGTRR